MARRKNKKRNYIRQSDQAFLSVFSIPDDEDGILQVKKLKTDIKLLVANTGTDLSKSYLNLPDRLRKKLRGAVREQYPDLFNTGDINVFLKRVGLADAYLGACHKLLQRSLARKARSNSQQHSRSVDEQIPTQDTSSEATANDISEILSPKLSLQESAQTRRVRRSPRKILDYVDVPMRKKKRTYKPHSSQRGGGTTRSSVDEEPGIVSSPASSAPPPPYLETTQVTPTNVTEMEGLKHFLSTCTPPMIRYISRFTAAGCRDLALLRAVSNLPDGMLKEFVEGLPKFDDGREMTYTERIILRGWFKTYFNRSDRDETGNRVSNNLICM